MRLGVIAALVGLTIVSMSHADDASALVRKPISIPPQPLELALQALARESEIQLIYKTAVVGQMHSPGASGEFTALEALTRILSGTGLTYTNLDDHTITIVMQAGPTSRGATEPAQNSADPPLQASSLAAQPPATLEEIVVTAQKRSERLQDVPVPVTALDAASLVAQNQLRLQDYFTSVPGLSLATRFDGSPQLTIRGITTGFNTNPTVGLTVDDVPYGSSTNLGGANYVPDFDPSDLARVEVLRGPQGTLYGANSLGGLVKYVTVDPSTAALSGHVQVGSSGVYASSTPGYNISASINVPLSDTIAVRASAFSRRDPGYIDNVETGAKDVNNYDVSGGRLVGLWRPSEAFSLKLGALIQDSILQGAPYLEQQPGSSGLEQSALPGTGQAHKKLQAYSATLAAKLGSVDVAAVTGYNINRASDTSDASWSALGLLLGPGAAGSNDTSSYKFTQEIRLSGLIGPHVEWLTGVFYTHEDTPYIQQIRLLDPATGGLISTQYNSSFPTTYAEYAAFADLTIHFTDRFDMQLGGRRSHIKETYSEVDTGPFAGPDPIVNPEVQANSNSVTYLATPRLKLSPDLMLYARIASGYRPGGPNSLCTLLGAPCTFGPDKTTNYDLGLKGDFLEHTLSVDASIYYIDWKDIQISLTDPSGVFSYIGNAGTAKSQGIELSGKIKPTASLSITGWVVWNDAELTEGFPASSTAGGGAYGADGDRLPYSARFSGNLALREEIPLTGRLTGFLGGSASYVGNRIGEFTSTPTRAEFPGYAQFDFLGGVKWDDWTVNLFVNNLADKRGVLYGGPGSQGSPPFAYFYIQPRTAGLSLTKNF